MYVAIKIMTGVNMNKLKVAIVGAGFVAQKRHIPAFLRLKKQVSVCAICDLKLELAKSVASRFDIPNVYSNLSDMLKKEKPDVVDITYLPRWDLSIFLIHSYATSPNTECLPSQYTKILAST